MAETIPGTVADITTEWIATALREGGTIDASTQVIAADVEALGEGVGMLGDLARITLRYEPDGAGPDRVIVKLPTLADVNRQRGMAFGFYEREANFYRHIGNAGRTGGLRVPRCYANQVDTAAERFALLLEDLSVPHDDDVFKPAISWEVLPELIRARLRPGPR